MDTLWVALGSFAAFMVAYYTYCRWLSCKVFKLDADAPVPSVQLRDDVDFVPTRKAVIFGHHFTSIAGTGPIVGPAVAVFWGWLPALLWVVFGAIFVGALHDLGALVVSLRNRGQTIGEIAGRVISPRARVLFLLILFFSLTVVLAIFGLVIASIFKLYPASTLSVWIAMPLAMAVGIWIYKLKGNLWWPSIISLILLYLGVYIGVVAMPISFEPVATGGVSFQVGKGGDMFTSAPLPLGNPVVAWTTLLMVYCFFASTWPVWLLLQPRDFINSQQLVVALGLLIIGLFVAGLTGRAQLSESAPALATQIPFGAPPIWPFLFITVACGACSGFHCLVSSGTSSKQLARETDAQYVACGSMLLEGFLAVIVILACCAGLGMGVMHEGTLLQGREAWLTRYDPSGNWADFRLGSQLAAFVDGAANLLTTLKISPALATGIVAVMVACFAATTLDTATRLQRYVIQELARTFHCPPLANKYLATLLAVSLGLIVAMMPAPGQPAGSGGLILWPLFGATNQLLAGLAFLVLVVYLRRREKPIWFAIPPMVLMLVMPAWGLTWQLLNPESGWLLSGDYLKAGFGLTILGLQAWMVVEGLLIWRSTRGVLEESLPPLKQPQVA